MGMTISEKILASHCRKKKVEPGELINAQVDIILGNDVTSPVAIKEFRNLGIEKVFDKNKVVIIPDHFVPNKDIKSAEQAKMVRQFAHEQELSNYFEVGKMGIEHCLLPQEGIVLPGDLVIGADSHTCTYGALGAFATGVGSTDMAAGMATGEVWFKVPETINFIIYGEKDQWVTGKDFILYIIGLIGVDGARYKSMEFTGETIKKLSMDSRFTITNMAIEAGGKNGIIGPDHITGKYVQKRAKREYRLYFSDTDAKYSEVYEINAADIEPQISFPHLPENAKGISQVGDIKIDQVVIGSCTNGRMEDLRQAAQILRGNKVHSEIRTIIIPGTQEIYKQALKEGLMEIFINAGAIISTPTCGPCCGGHMGILAKGEKAVSTTNRNFVGRMGHPESEVYLSGPLVAAASAVRGRISAPWEVKQGGV